MGSRRWFVCGLAAGAGKGGYRGCGGGETQKEAGLAAQQHPPVDDQQAPHPLKLFLRNLCLASLGHTILHLRGSALDHPVDQRQPQRGQEVEDAHHDGSRSPHLANTVKVRASAASVKGQRQLGLTYAKALLNALSLSLTKSAKNRNLLSERRRKPRNDSKCVRDSQARRSSNSGRWQRTRGRCRHGQRQCFLGGRQILLGPFAGERRTSRWTHLRSSARRSR